MVIKKEYNKIIIYWLYLILFTLFIMVLVGGLTRLTDSGLSITTWDVVKGILPPLNQNDWNIAFDLYKQIPQFYIVNPNISLDEFKIIFYWEYFHRLIGRIFGLIFLIPFIYFLINKVFINEYNIKLGFLFLLILLQGFIGWYMVKSGLTENTTVSHFRLALHLNLALILYSASFWYLLNFKTNINKIFFQISSGNKILMFFVFLIFLQITFGAFVSGLDAGQIYQTWPTMNGNYFPDDIKSNSVNLNNLFYTHSLVQFIHRNIAYLIFIYSLCILFNIFYFKKKNLYIPSLIVFLFIIFQMTIGILTLVSGLYVGYASLHQLSTIFLLSSSVYLYHKSIN